MDKDTEWCWLNIHQLAFDRMKKYIPGEPSVHTVALAKMAKGLSVSPKRLEELRAATASDCALQKLMQVTMKGWPAQKSDSDLDVRAYYNVRQELTVQDRSADQLTQEHHRHGTSLASGYTGIYMSPEGCCVLATDEPRDHRLCESV